MRYCGVVSIRRSYLPADTPERAKVLGSSLYPKFSEPNSCVITEASQGIVTLSPVWQGSGSIRTDSRRNSTERFQGDRRLILRSDQFGKTRWMFPMYTVMKMRKIQVMMMAATPSQTSQLLTRVSQFSRRRASPSYSSP